MNLKIRVRNRGGLNGLIEGYVNATIKNLDLKDIIMKNRTTAIIFLAGAFLLAGCAKEAVDQGPSPAGEEPLPAPTEMAVTEEVEMSAAEPEPQAESAGEKPVIQMVIPRNDYVDIEQLPPGSLPSDSAAYSYIIRPDDYLTKIAFNEYGNPNEWQNIYRWNRSRIGDDPNLIYPFRALELYKPEGQIKEIPYDFVMHTVKEGETLWTIAGAELQDERAWIILFWDNEDLLKSNAGLLHPGMELQVRSRLW